jgi:hypothetical protein
VDPAHGRCGRESQICFDEAKIVAVSGSTINVMISEKGQSTIAMDRRMSDIHDRQWPHSKAK